MLAGQDCARAARVSMAKAAGGAGRRCPRLKTTTSHFIVRARHATKMAMLHRTHDGQAGGQGAKGEGENGCMASVGFT